MVAKAVDWGGGLKSLTQSIPAPGGLTCRRMRPAPVDVLFREVSGESMTNPPFSPKSPRSPLSSKSDSTAQSQARYAEPDQALLFLDWDDTLFPSTEVFDRWGVPSKPELWADVEFSPEQDAALAVWRSALYEHLCTAACLSERVVIVTNSRSPWVSDCAAHFAPNILPLLEKMRVVYAREDVPISPKLRSLKRDVMERLPHAMDEMQLLRSLQLWKRKRVSSILSTKARRGRTSSVLVI